MSSESFAQLATVTGVTKRSPGIVAGIEQDLTIIEPALKILPLDPVDSDIASRSELRDFTELLQTAVEGAPDIREGDVLVVGSTEYVIRSVGDWDWFEEKWLHLIVEESKSRVI